ncbi:hypothetical protein [Parasegetibacter sp. NRK P23]|uniref:hypothetical protein n=1 Tax=Parasegetibacter sp. NRK P23 TaxID=2942999 RepID=UPI0020432F4C|nr:hypothetical protein [Parasegetibacter sp. NRK P23]MCM5528215.1 hypothetical protein [Parasegetibacter sp. NRK P23]
MELNATVRKLDNGYVLEAFGASTAIETSVAVVSTLGEKLNDVLKEMEAGDAGTIQIVFVPITDTARIL